MDRYGFFGKSRYSERPRFGSLNTPSAAMDKPYPDNRHIAQATMEVPVPERLPPYSENAMAVERPLDSNNVPLEFGAVYNLPDSSPALPYAKLMMNEYNRLSNRAEMWREQANSFGRGGKYDRPILRHILPGVNSRLISQEQEALRRADENQRNAVALLKGAYDVGNTAKQNQINASNVAMGGVTRFAGQPTAGIRNFMGVGDANVAFQNAIGLAENNNPEQRRFNDMIKFMNADAQHRASMGRPQTNEIAQQFNNQAEMFRRGGGADEIQNSILTAMQAMAKGTGNVPTGPALRSLASAQTSDGIDVAMRVGMDVKQIRQQRLFNPLLSIAFPQGVDDKSMRQATATVMSSFPEQLRQQVAQKMAERGIDDPLVAQNTLKLIAQRVVMDYQQSMQSMSEKR